MAGAAAASEEEEAVGRYTDLFTLDLVSFTPGRPVTRLLDCGLVLGFDGDDTDTFTALRIDGSLVTKKNDGIGIIDRSTLHISQIVGSASDIGGQIGVVTGVTTTLAVVRFNSRCQPTKVVMGVTPAGLRHVRGLSLGDYVVSGTWLGRVVEVSLDIDVLFDDGALCTVTDVEPKKLQLLKTRHCRPQMNTVFYPGAGILTSDSSDIFAEARWLNGQWTPDRQRGKVTKVEMAGVFVYWIASAEYGIERRLFHDLAPPAYLYPHDLTYFCSDPDCTWALADRCFLTSTDNEDQKYTSSGSPVPPPTMTVGNTNTVVDVLWQDGTRQYGARSTIINPSEFTNEFEFFPGQYVVDNSPTIDDDELDGTRDDVVSATGGSISKRIGVVRSVNSKDHTVNVSWFKASSTWPAEVDRDDVVSAYDLRRDPDHTVFYGDIVVRLLSNIPKSRLVEEQREAERASTDLSWVGRVVDLHDGQVQVEWGDGSTSTVWPHEISVANKEHYTQLPVDEWVEEDGVDAPQADNEQHDPADGTEVEGGVSSADEVDGLHAYVSSGSHEDPNVAATETRTDTSVDDDSEDDAAETLMIKAKDDDTDLSKFARFDVVKSPPDHHYSTVTTDQDSSGGKRWVKTVQKEWKILQNSLPETIYVRGFEDRMDLLRVVMVGASGTPYHDGLFFFDLQLPPSYPAVPPQVYYHSFGLRLNPNLYESGTVCLSLLNTFGGEGTEVWSPTTSSILQVVVSLQALILNDQPYYNEAGYEHLANMASGKRNALPYSSNAFVLTLRTALHLLRRPPKGFEEFVRDHFRRRGRYVLEMCHMYMQGGAPADHESMELSCSTGFRMALANVVPRLVAAFGDIGAEGCQCDH